LLSREGKKTIATEARCWIEIQRVTYSPDSEGGFTKSWALVTNCFSAIYPIKAIQRYEYKTINVEATHYFKIRGYIDCQETDRICFNGRYFEVLTIENIQENNLLLFIVCKEHRK